MGYYDNPQIDGASKHSEESEHALRAFINKKNGFICRTLSPDNGCDFLAELITNNGATSWHFGIQLKSILHPSIIEEGTKISYPFDTSRLGYLMRQIPSGGLIVIYDASSEKCYFEYVEKIVKDLYANKGNGWENQEKVNIKISINNHIDGSALHQITRHFETIFRNSSLMQDSFGHLYGLPNSGLKRERDEVDFNNPNEVELFLEEQGTNLMIEYDLHLVDFLLGKLTERQILGNTRILSLSSVIKCELGQFDLSELQCNKALKKKDITADERILVRYARCKALFKLQKFSLSEVIEEMENILYASLSEQSSLTVEINLLYFKLAGINIGDPVSEEFQQQIFSLYQKIDGANLTPKVNNILTLWNSTNYSSYINAVFLRDANVLAHSEPPHYLGPLFKRLAELNLDFLNKVEQFHTLRETENNVLVRAFALQVWLLHILQINISILNIRPTADGFSGFAGNLQQLINRGLTAYNYFCELRYFTEGYNTLCYTLEFIEMGRLFLGKDLYQDIKSLYEIKESIEEESSIAPYALQMPKLAEKFTATFPESPRNDLTKEQIDFISEMLAKARGLTPDQMMNAFGEVQAYQVFFQRCTDPDIELLSSYVLPDEKKYDLPVRYVLRNKVGDLISAPSFNISKLLSNWGY